MPDFSSNIIIIVPLLDSNDNQSAPCALCATKRRRLVIFQISLQIFIFLNFEIPVSRQNHYPARGRDNNFEFSREIKREELPPQLCSLIT